MEAENLYNRVKRGFREYLTDSTTIVAIGTPISAAMETGIAGMSDEVSINARLIAIGLTYGGLGSVVSKGRDLWRNRFKITDNTKEKIQLIHDTAYLTALGLTLNPVFYYASGARDLKEIALGTAAATGLTFLLGGPAGYAIDTARDLTGVKESQRVPRLIRERSSKVKKGLAALAIAGSLGLIAGIYGLTSNKSDVNFQPKVVGHQISNGLNKQGEMKNDTSWDGLQNSHGV